MTKLLNSKFIACNPMVDIISYACSKCYKTREKSSYLEKENYIERRISSGHESILEHGNYITEYIVDKNFATDIIDIFPSFKYLNVKVKDYGLYYYILLAGSPRAYKHIFRTFVGANNQLLNLIRREMEITMNSSFLKDFIDDDIIKESHNSTLCESYQELKEPVKLNEYATILNADNLSYIFHELDGRYSIDDLLDICTVTIDFTNISRVISQQFTRHRNGITQESQRYVDYSNQKFNSPEIFNIDLEKDKKYIINDKETTLDNLGQDIIKIYPQLLNQGLKKEDARAFLPNNVTTSFVMTFTYRNLISFLKLRTHKSAQNEIRFIARSIEEWFIYYVHETINESLDIYAYLEPGYKTSQDNDYIPNDANISEYVNPFDENGEYSEEDYI